MIPYDHSALINMWPDSHDNLESILFSTNDHSIAMQTKSRANYRIAHAHAEKITCLIMDKVNDVIYSSSSDNTIKAWVHHSDDCEHCASPTKAYKKMGNLNYAEPIEVKTWPIHEWTNVHHEQVGFIAFGSEKNCKTMYSAGDDQNIYKINLVGIISDPNFKGECLVVFKNVYSHMVTALKIDPWERNLYIAD